MSANIIEKINARKDISEIEKERRIRAVEILEAHFGAKDQADDGARRKELEAMTKAQLVELVLSREAAPKGKGPTVGDAVVKVMMDKDAGLISYEALAWIITAMYPERNTSDKSIASTIKAAKQKLGLVFPRQL